MKLQALWVVIGDAFLGPWRCRRLRELVRNLQTAAESAKKLRDDAIVDRNAFERDLGQVRRAHAALLREWGVKAHLIQAPKPDGQPIIVMGGPPDIAVNFNACGSPTQPGITQLHAYTLSTSFAVHEDSYPDTIDIPTFVAMNLIESLRMEQMAHKVAEVLPSRRKRVASR